MGGSSNDLVPRQSASTDVDDTLYIERTQPTLFPHEVEAARRYADASRAPSTRRFYATDWEIFTAWCAERGFEPLPADPAAVALFLAAEADRGLGPSGVGRRAAAIKYHHKRAGLEPPQARKGAAAIAEVLSGVRRSRTAPPRRKRPSDADMLRDMLKVIEGDDVRAQRDRALLAIGMAGAFRRSEVVALLVSDVAFVAEGLRVTIQRAKTDQEGLGATVAIPEGRRIRPKALLLGWLEAAGHSDGPLFRRLTPGGKVTGDPMSDRAVARLVQACAAKAGYAPEDYAGHSLRSGFLTEAARNGASIFKMREVSRHKSMQVLSDYVRDAELFRDHAGDKFL